MLQQSAQQPQAFLILHNRIWAKLLLKTPILLWRLGLQALIDRFLVLITHWGRKSGLPRRTVTEYHFLDGKIYVPCALGEQSQWYQNIQANPHVTLQTAEGTVHALARRVMVDNELLGIYRDMKTSYDPLLFRYYLQSLGIEDTPADFIANKGKVYFLIFDPTDEPTPPPIDTDLRWVWPLLIPVIALWLLRRIKLINV